MCFDAPSDFPGLESKNTTLGDAAFNKKLNREIGFFVYQIYPANNP